MSQSGSSVFRKLHGIFSVYKPPDVICSVLRDTLEMKLLKELNALRHASQEQMLFLPESVADCNATELTRVVTSVPSLVSHTLVKGQAYKFVKIGIGHKLDKLSSGIQVFGIGDGAKLLTVMEQNHFTRDYTVCGRFGRATADFLDTGKVIEKTTFDHISKDKFQRVLAMIQGAHQKSLIMHSQVDLNSQEAYDLAVQGQLRPKVSSPPLILAMQCLEFSPPDFKLEIRCMHETQQYLRKLVHEIGLELRSTAVCTKVRRTRDGPFTLDSALTRSQWDLNSICNALKECQPKAIEILNESMDLNQKNTDSEELHSSVERRT